MGLINGSLQIGKSALMSHQSMIQILGNNIANAGNPDYKRQSGRLSPIRGARLPEGFDPGAGVRLTGLQRHVDSAIEQRLRDALGENKYDDQTSQVLARLETLYNEMSDNDLSSSLSQFFNAFSELQSKPQDSSTRAVTVQTAQSLTEQIQTLRHDIVGVYNDLSKTMSETVDEVNRITSQIAQLNGEIAQTTSSGGNAGAVLDERDRQLKDLSQLVNIHVFEQDSGTVTVYVGSDPIVQHNQARKLEINKETKNGLILPELVFSDTGKKIDSSSGTAGAVIDLINDYVSGNIHQLDDLSSSIIFEVNKIHSSGQGLKGYTSTTSTYAVSNADEALNNAGLAFTPQNGTFMLNVKDLNTGQTTTHQINIDLDGLGTDTTLNSLAAQINAVNNVNASVTGNGKLELSTTNKNYEMTFSQDGSHTLAALGINSFFSGKNAFDIAVNSDVADNPQLIAAAKDNLPGDGTNAASIAALRTKAIDSLGGLSIPGQYRSIVGELATKTAGARQRKQVHQAIVDTLTAQSESVSGVNLDEETVHLMSSQQAFQGAAKYISSVNAMMQEILNLI